LGEVLEHVPRVEPFIAEVEEKVREGGWILVTLPRGPWESMSFEKNRREGIKPSHVRSWEYRDVLEVFGQKDGFELGWSPCGQTPFGEPVGHWLVAYRLARRSPDENRDEGGRGSGAGAGEFDHARKLICSPRQTLSVCMILGGEEAGSTLHRCLRSVRPVADEIIIAASGCDEETLRIAGQYADAIFEIPWLEEDGLPNFAVGRNRSIEKASCDWILWLDADEYLVGASELPKYLRPNIYNAYVVRQWHHAIDAHFEPDLPMRCFRSGLGVKFFGAIHEHPETALNMGISPHVILTDVNIIHDGYVTEEKRVGRFRRNLPVLVKDRRLFPERRLGKLFWLRDLVQSARHEMMANGGPTRHAHNLLEEAIELYRAEFSSATTDFHNQARALYEQALQLLGRGHPVAVLVGAPNDSRRPEIRRVETVEELKGELWHMAASAFDGIALPGDEFAFG
jgi:glycosyltransferase involved in cell wall biosynthesis